MAPLLVGQSCVLPAVSVRSASEVGTQCLGVYSYPEEHLVSTPGTSTG